MTIFLTVIDVVIVFLIGYFLYWQQKIDVAGKYSSFQLVFAGFLFFWFIGTGISNFLYIILIAGFITIVVLTGTNGLTPSKIIAVGMFDRVIPLANLTSVTLMPLALPDGRTIILAVFAVTKRRLIRLSFRGDVEEFVSMLKKRIPETVEISVQQG